MRLVRIGISAIEAECEIARKELQRIYDRCIANGQHHDLLVILGNMDIVTVDKGDDRITISGYRGADFSSCRFQINDFVMTDTVDCMMKWGNQYPSHVIGYAYEREDD